ncbi:hypothetical protein GXP67_12005 [Rhodocytophaga rosea]|uniref:Uncharacterized protein n=1 Tax=Rhodocytophaga rosea TaxID=2704465 RepID=A0A6C0GH11_9BACT|nr:hypothetical protein [Rhodocytophaga rosea]QHT67306.1 hypothetical protein GXP67_12005 [Rhodocytophaga rosea]
MFYYLKSTPLPIFINVLDHSTEQAMRTGVIGDHVYDFDLERVNLDQYKAVVFMNVYKLTDSQRKFILQKVAGKGRTLVWNYLSGYTNGERLDLDFVKALTGMRLERINLPQAPSVEFLQPAYSYGFKESVDPLVVINDNTVEPLATLQPSSKPIIARKQLKAYTSVFCALPLNGTEGFREIFRKAGCHIYNEQNDFTYAHSGLILLHTKEGGERTIKLKNGKLVTLHLEKGVTILLDGLTGEVVLK